MAEVICDTSPLQYLYQAELLDLVPRLFGRIIVPEAVAAELGECRRLGVAVPDVAELEWAEVRRARERRVLPLAVDLGPGEREALALGLESADALLVLDDALARRHARLLGIEVVGTVGVLLRAKRAGLIEAVRPVLDRLDALCFRLSSETRATVLDLAGESRC